jgi:hypothetical protein
VITRDGIFATGSEHDVVHVHDGNVVQAGFGPQRLSNRSFPIKAHVGFGA